MADLITSLSSSCSTVQSRVISLTLVVTTCLRYFSRRSRSAALIDSCLHIKAISLQPSRRVGREGLVGENCTQYNIVTWILIAELRSSLSRTYQWAGGGLVWLLSRLYCRAEPAGNLVHNQSVRYRPALFS